MSATDQAFIRAYQDLPMISGTIPLDRAPPLDPQVKANLQGPGPSADVLASHIAATKTTASASSSSVASADGLAQAHTQIIFVDMESAVPPPHVPPNAFAAVSARLEALQASPTHATASATTPSAIRASPQAPPASATFGASPKAALSSFAAASAGASAAEPLKPASAIASARWPAICETLLAQHGERFNRLAVDVRRGAKTGQKVTGITGIHRDEGRTTLMLCLARRLASNNMKLALVDADFARPQLAKHLGIDASPGWEGVLKGEHLLADVMVELVADRMTLVPLGAPVNVDWTGPTLLRIATTLSELTEWYDIVLVDAGPLSADSASSRWLVEANVGIQNLIVAHDVRRSQASQLASSCLELLNAGYRHLGIAEMFTS